MGGQLMATRKEFELSQPTVNLSDGLAIAKGFVHRFSHINKFGYNPTIGSNFETVWDGSNNYSYPATAGTIQATSTDGNDTGATLVVSGLDENYETAEETITVGGDRGTTNFIRVFRAFVATPGTGQTTNVGIITILHTQSDSTDTTVAKILAGNGQTLMAVYTVPAGKQAYIKKFQGSIGKDKEAQFIGLARPFGGAFRVQGQWITSGVPITYDYPVPLKFGEKTDFEVRVKADATTSGGAIFDIILEDLV